jgi:MFS family permease
MSKIDPYASLKVKEFRLFVGARFLLTLSTQVQEVVVGWQVYQITNDPFSLGLVGLVEAIPSIAISLFGGHLADTFNRKRIIQLMVGLLFLCSAGLFSISKFGFFSATETWPLYLIIFISGIARGMLGPALFSFWPQLIKNKEIFTNAITWNTTGWQIAATLGPAVGGLLIAPLGIANTYLVDLGLMGSSLLCFSLIAAQPMPERIKEDLFANLTNGIKFVFGNQVILGALTLDLFAVLFGGATALLPLFAKDILHVGAFEFGLLKAAIPIGSIITALSLAYFPIKKNAGRTMLLAVAGFGVCMIGFGLSQILWLSIFILFLSGICDGISVVIRGTLIQTETPDNMKGRVSAVNNIFIGSSNEIGAFESGSSAKLIGAVPSVIFGGFMSLLVVAITSWKAKKLRGMDLD